MNEGIGARAATGIKKKIKEFWRFPVGARTGKAQL
jgi:hypothetical protein